MSSTDSDRERRLLAFYAGQLSPAAERLRARGVEFFPRRPEAAEPTYYVDRRVETGYITEYDSSRLGAELAHRWEQSGEPELVELIDGLLDLAESLEASDLDSTDVSPFIYAMF